MTSSAPKNSWWSSPTHAPSRRTGCGASSGEAQATIPTDSAYARSTCRDPVARASAAVTSADLPTRRPVRAAREIDIGLAGRCAPHQLCRRARKNSTYGRKRSSLRPLIGAGERFSLRKTAEGARQLRRIRLPPYGHDSDNTDKGLRNRDRLLRRLNNRISSAARGAPVKAAAADATLAQCGESPEPMR